MPHEGCKGVGWAACLKSSRRGSHSWENHVAPRRAAPEQLWGGGVAAPAAAWPESGANLPGQGYCRERLEQLEATFPLSYTLSSPPMDTWQQEAQGRPQPRCFSCLCPPRGAGSEPERAEEHHAPSAGEGMGIWSRFARALFGLVSAKPI